ncbi:probable mitochondrial uncoupling protein 2 [Coccomyxa sp. Obi]|nr:probable mitochondrial uncoupling protein 2 [Coccomyxa sp. Obi]
MEKQSTPNSVFKEFLTSGLSVSAANVCTNPIDVVKVRMQLQSMQLAGNGRLIAPSLLQTGVTVVQSEGYAALMSGVSATVARGLFYGGLRLGMYGPMKTAMGADTDPTVLKKVAAGSASGAIATFITNPIELLKTRLQSCSTMGPLQIIKKIIKQDGVTGLWKGTMPSAVRGTLLTASQCATYDDTKRLWMRTTGWRDGLGTHVGVSMITGLAATTITQPVDMVKTHMYCNGSKYANPLSCAADLFAKEGARGFFKGWTANYARLGPQTTLMFVFMENIRHITGMKAL